MPQWFIFGVTDEKGATTTDGEDERQWKERSPNDSRRVSGESTPATDTSVADTKDHTGNKDTDNRKVVRHLMHNERTGRDWSG